MRKFTTIVLVLLAQVSLAQNWSWVKQFGQSPNPDQTNELDIYDLKFSSNGNIYVTGSYISNVVIGGVTYLGYPDASSTSSDVFIAKFDENGNVLWVKTVGSPSGDLPEALTVDSNDNIYLSGRFSGTCDFGSSHTLVSTGGFDSFIAKYNSSGQIQWAIKSAYGGANDRTIAITIGQDSHIYAAGLSKGDFTVGDGSTGDSYTNPDSKNDLFLASYTTSGTYRWSKQIPGNNDNNIFRSIACDEQNNLYVGGALAGTLTVDGIDYTSIGSGDIILMKARPTDGSAIWVRKGGSTADDQLNSIAVNDNFAYLIGYIQGTGTIDSTATLQSSQFKTTGGNDIFLAKYNLEGRLLWKKTLGSAGADVGYGLNTINNILVATGYFSNTINFNLNSITSGGGMDAAFFVFDVESNAVLAKSVSGTLEDRGQGVALDSSYNAYLGGYFMSPTLSVGTTALTNSASTFKDLFLAKYHNEFTAAFTNKKNVTCNGGSNGELTVTPYFGTPPYTFTWKLNGNPYAETDSAITNLGVGTYEVTVTDYLSNTSTLSYTVTQPAALSIGHTQNNVSCYGKQNGTINITVSGGTPSYTYFWTSSDGLGHVVDAEDQTGLTAGTYSVEVTDHNGCTANGSYTITQPTRINITGEVTNITGSGSNGAVDITVSGGSGTYSSYAWYFNDIPGGTHQDTTGINNGGDYKVVVTDNTVCKDSNTFTVLDERIFHGWIVTKTNVSCKGGSDGSATVSWAKNTGTVTILWSPDGETTATISGKPAGSYTATLTDDMGTPGDTGDDMTINVDVDLTEPAQPLGGGIVSYPVTCHGGSNGILDLTPSGGTLPYSYSWNTIPAKTTQDINNLPAGNYEVTITDSKGCTTVVPGTVSEPDAISFSFAFTQPTCHGTIDGSLAVSGLTGGTPGYSYLWSNTLTSSSISNIKSGSYWLKVTDSKGCYNTQSTYLDQPAALTISHVANQPTCPESKNGSIGITVGGGTSPYTYFWTGPDVANPTDEDLVNLGVGTYNVTVTDANGCTKDYQVVLSEANPSPSAILSSSDTNNEICDGDNVVFTASGGSTYEFFLNGTSVQGPGAGYAYNNSTLINNDEVFAEVTSSAGCKALTNTISTIVHTLPTVTANASPNPICEGDPVTLTGSGATSYLWDKEVTDGVPFYPTTTDSYTVTGTDDNGCTDTDQITVTVNPVPDAQINTTDPTSYCEGETISTLLNASPSDGSFYQWIRNSANISGAHTSTYTVTEEGLYSFYVIKNGCMGISDEVEIVVHSLPTVTLAAFDPVCLDAEPFALTGGDPVGGIYSGTGVTGGTFDPAAAGAGTHSITYSYTDANGCSNSASKDMVVNALPVVSLADFDPVCLDAEPFTLTGGNPEGGIYSGTGVTGGTFDPAAAGAGTHTITYSYTDANGCSASASEDMVVNGLPTANINTTDPTDWCEGTPINVNLTADVAESYQWLLDGQPITGETGQTLIATQAGTYSVAATTNGCNSTGNTITITVISTPSVAITTEDPTTWCAGDEVSVQLTAIPSSGDSYRWIKDEVTIAGETQSNYTANEPGNYRVEALFAGGCSSVSEIFSLTENPVPTVSIATDTIQIDTSSTYTFDAGAGFVSYLWSDTSTGQTLLVDGAVTGTGEFTYWVTVTNEFSCSASDTAVVVVSPVGGVPTQISWEISIYPNPSSGEFKLKVSGIEPGTYTLTILNAGGQIVYGSTFSASDTEITRAINIQTLSKGLYYVRFENTNKGFTRKIILK